MIKTINKSKLIARAFSSRKIQSQHRSISDEYLGKSSYWLSYYKNNHEQVEWLADSKEVASLICDKIHNHFPSIRHPLRMLDLGSGTSLLGPEIQTLLGKDKVHLTYYDISQDALLWQHGVLQGRRNAGQVSTCGSFVKGDVCQLPFIMSSFDIVTDKGTIDSLLKNQIYGQQKSSQMLRQCIGILTPGGILMQVTDEDPELRINLLEQCLPSMNISYSSIEDNLEAGFERFLYCIFNTKM